MQRQVREQYAKRRTPDANVWSQVDNPIDETRNANEQCERRNRTPCLGARHSPRAPLHHRIYLDNRVPVTHGSDGTVQLTIRWLRFAGGI